MTPENVAKCMDFSKLDLAEIFTKEPEAEAAAAASEDDEQDLEVSEVWDTNGKSFYKHDESGIYYDKESGEEVEAFEEGEKPKETKKKFAHKKK